MTKEKTKPTDTKRAKDSVSSKTETKIEKGDSPSTTSPDKPSTDGKNAKSAPSDSPAAKKKAFVRGEAQKPVTKEYRNNWNSIFKKK